MTRSGNTEQQARSSSTEQLAEDFQRPNSKCTVAAWGLGVIGKTTSPGFSMHDGVGEVEVLEDQADLVSLPGAGMDLASRVRAAMDLTHKKKK